MARRGRPAKRAAALSDGDASDVESQHASSRKSESADNEELLEDSKSARNGAKAAIEVEDEDADEAGDEDEDEGDLDEDE